MSPGPRVPSTPPTSVAPASPPAAARRPARRVGTAGLAGLIALGTLPAITFGTAAHAAVTVGSNISVFPDRDMVVAVGYEAGEQLLVEAVRNGVVIGTTQGPAVETPEGTGLEVNHGPLGTPLPGDCWTNYTPDIIGGDVIRVTPVDRANAVSDTMTVADVAFSGAPVQNADGSVSVSGTATPGTDFAVEFRRDKPDPRFRRGPFVPAFQPGTNSWTATFRPTATSAEGLTAEQQRQIALSEASWLAVADDITETTLAELGEPGGVGPGCVGSADPNTMVGGLEPITITSGDVTFSGTARAGVQAVTVTVGALGDRAATYTPDPVNPSTWTLTVPKADLLTLPDGNVAVTPRFDTLVGAARNVLKDTVAPLAPVASIPSGTYSATQSVALNKPAGEGTSKVYWEIGNTAVPDPDEFSNPYTGQISVTSTQTLKGRLIDVAGNLGAVGTFDYRIGTPPAAPSGLTATESPTAPGAANLRWTAATGATGYNVYRNDVKVNTAPLTGTSYADTAAGLGDHSYVVRAVEANGIESLDSNRVGVTIAAPAVPTGLRATAGDSRVTLNWTAVSGAASYRVYRDGVVVASAVAATSYINAGLTNGTLYEYAIASLDAGGNESPRTGIVQAVPQVPADTTAPPASTVNPVSGTYTSALTVTAANGEAGVTHRYTVGAGTTVPADPTTADATLPAGGLPVSASSVVKVAAFDAANNRSVVTRTYTITTTTTPPAGTRTVTLTPVADTMARQSLPTSTAGGTATTLLADSEATNGSVSTRDTAYLRFDVPALAAGESITAASLSLHLTNDTTNGPQIFRTGTTWGETGVSWNSGAPARSGSAVGNFGSMALGRVSTPVSGVTSGLVSFELFGEINNGIDFSSRESGTAGNRPQLNLTISTGGTTPTPPPTTDSAAPTVASRAPSASATGVAVTGNVTATFSEAVQGVSNTTFTLRSAAGAVGAGVTYNTTTRVATLDPTANLAAGTTYTATLTGGSTSVRDMSNNPLATESWTFTTAAATAPTTRTVTLTPAADTMARNLAPSTASGSVTTLNVDAQETDGNAATRANGYLRFTIPALATGERITGATFSVQVTNATTNGPEIWRTATAWTESTMTWNTGQPARSGSAAVGNFGSMALGRVSTPVSGITAAGDVSFQLFADFTDGVDFSSKETATAANRPQLTLTIQAG